MNLTIKRFLEAEYRAGSYCRISKRLLPKRRFPFDPELLGLPGLDELDQEDDDA